MAKAYYTTDNIGHYGLAFPYYTHFTSPIRRYPDMMVHRLLARYLAGGKPADKTELEDLCARASDREVVAAEAERASIKYKMVEFMKEHIGEEFEGHISGLTEWGVYVELDETHIEGMSFLRDIEARLLHLRRAALRNHRPLDGHPHDAGQPGTHPREARRPAKTPVRLRTAAARGRGAPYGRAPRQRPEGAHLVAPQRTVVTERAPVRP